VTRFSKEEKKPGVGETATLGRKKKKEGPVTKGECADAGMGWNPWGGRQERKNQQKGI